MKGFPIIQWGGPEPAKVFSLNCAGHNLSLAGGNWKDLLRIGSVAAVDFMPFGGDDGVFLGFAGAGIHQGVAFGLLCLVTKMLFDSSSDALGDADHLAGAESAPIFQVTNTHYDGPLHKLSCASLPPHLFGFARPHQSNFGFVLDLLCDHGLIGGGEPGGLSHFVGGEGGVFPLPVQPNLGTQNFLLTNQIPFRHVFSRRGRASPCPPSEVVYCPGNSLRSSANGTN